ncbi:hypothetical protein YC2023_082350 [Brassica napus]
MNFTGQSNASAACLLTSGIMISTNIGSTRLNINCNETYKASGETYEARTISDLSGLQHGDKRSVGPHLWMNSRQVLRDIHGAWNLHQNGEWSFERKTNDLGFPAIVRMSENFDSLERIIRSLYNLSIGTPILMTYRLPEWMLIPDGNKTPPITILQTPDVQVMMAVRAWFADLTLSVTIGAEDVSRYQFFCRADFNIGSSSYKFRNGNEDPSFEDDTDSDGDGTEPLGSNKLSITVFNTGKKNTFLYVTNNNSNYGVVDIGASSNQESPFPTNGLIISEEINGLALDSEYIPQPNVFNGIPVQFAVDEDLVIVQSSSPVIDDGISFWEGVIASENDNDVKDDEHSDEMDLDIPMSQNISQLQQNGTTNVDDANSSTDSTPDLDEVNNVVLIMISGN